MTVTLVLTFLFMALCHHLQFVGLIPSHHEPYKGRTGWEIVDKGERGVLP